MPAIIPLTPANRSARVDGSGVLELSAVPITTGPSGHASKLTISAAEGEITNHKDLSSAKAKG